jgi:hypothetical protein
MGTHVLHPVDGILEGSGGLGRVDRLGQDICGSSQEINIMPCWTIDFRNIIKLGNLVMMK